VQAWECFSTGTGRIFIPTEYTADMKRSENVYFFTKVWPAVCRAQHLDPRDDETRHGLIASCMQAIGGPDTDSLKGLGDDEATALFTFCRFLANENAETSARWLACQKDYVAFNRAQQADWHERALYGNRINKLDRYRFKGRRSAVGEMLEKFDPDEARKRHLTMAVRHRNRLRRERMASRVIRNRER